MMTDRKKDRKKWSKKVKENEGEKCKKRKEGRLRAM